MIDKKKLLELIRKLEPFNNPDCPKWVLDIIKNMKGEDDTDDRK